MTKNPHHNRRGNILAALSALAALLLTLLLSACQPAVPFFPRQPPPGVNTPSGGLSTGRNPAATAPAASEQPTLTPRPSATASPSPTPLPTSPLGVEPGDLSGVQLTFWHNLSGSSLGILHGLVDEFNASNEWGIQVKAEPQGSLDELYAKAGALDPASWPDILIAYLPQAIAWDQSHGLVDLNAYVDDPVWGMTKDEQAGFYPAFWEQDLFQSRRLGLPAQRFASLLYYNQTWGRELGFSSPPATPADFREQVCAAAASKRQDDNLQNDALGGWIVSTGHPEILSWLYAFGSALLPPGDQASEGAYTFDTQPAEAAFTYLRELYDRGCAWVSANDPPQAEFAARDGLLAAGSISDLPYQDFVFQQQDSQDQWTVLPFPSPSGEPAITVYGPSYSVATSTPARELAAWLFLKWLLQPNNQARLVAESGALPLSLPAREALQDYAAAHPHWAAAVDLLPLARPEPGLPSWDLVRWALSDAATQLFRDYFTIDRVPDLLRLLDETADDLSISPLTDRFLQGGGSQPTATPTVVPSTTGTPTP